MSGFVNVFTRDGGEGFGSPVRTSQISSCDRLSACPRGPDDRRGRGSVRRISGRVRTLFRSAGVLPAGSDGGLGALVRFAGPAVLSAASREGGYPTLVLPLRLQPCGEVDVVNSSMLELFNSGGTVAAVAAVGRVAARAGEEVELVLNRVFHAHQHGERNVGVVPQVVGEFRNV